MADLESGWYYGVGDQPQGPVPLTELKELLAGGLLTPETKVWHKTLGKEWKPAREVPAVQAASVSPAKPASAQDVSAKLASTQEAKSTEASLGEPSESAAPAVADGAAGPDVTGPAAQEEAESDEDEKYEQMKAELRARSEEELVQRQRTMRIVKFVALGIAVVIALCAGAAYMKHQRIYKDPLLLRYGKFADLRFKKSFDQAAKYCVEDSSISRWLLKEKAHWNRPAAKMQRKLEGGGSPQILFSGYKLLQKTDTQEGQGAILMVEQKIRTFRGNTPAQQVLTSEHTVTMVKEGEAWKITTVTEDDKSVTDPMSGMKITPME